MMKHFAIITSLFLTFSTLGTVSAFASGDGNCQPIYGGGQTCQTPNTIAVHKTVLDPKDNTYKDQISMDHPFSPNDTITFKITVTNPTSSTETNIKVVDTFPKQYILNNSGNPGTFDNTAKTLTFTIDSLGANQSKDTTVKATVVSNDQLPSNLGTSCLVNQAQATVNNVSDQDNVSFCIQKPGETKGGLPVYPAPNTTTTPQTGPEALGLLALLPTGIGGLFLRRKSAPKK